MRNDSRWHVIVLIMSLFVCLPAISAEIRRDSTRFLVLDGEIQPGDAAKLSRVFGLGSASAVTDLVLISPGGDLAEAMKIGRLVRKLKISTMVPSRFDFDPTLTAKIAANWGVKDPSRFSCLSACFFVFVAGISRDQIPLDAPALGVHRPYLRPADALTTNVDAALEGDSQTQRIVESYLEEMGVGRQFAEKMYATPKDQIAWITTEEFEAGLQGFTPQLSSWVSARCEKQTDSDRRIWELVKHKTQAQLSPAERVMTDAIREKMKQERKCQDELKIVTAADAIQEYMASYK